MKLKLTERQACFIYHMLDCGQDQHEKFLLHDGWDDELTKKERHRLLSTERDFLRAKKIFLNAYKKAEVA